MLTHQSDQLGHVARQAQSLKSRRFEQSGDAFTQKDVVRAATIT
jgi:hypothetical protein